jgi:hypothetical protein
VTTYRQTAIACTADSFIQHKKKHVWEVDTSFLSYCFGLVKSWDDYIPLAVWVNLLLVAGCSNLKMARKTQNSERAGCLSLHCL